MKKVILLIICTLSLGGLKAQTKGIAVEGKCYEIIQGLRDYYNNDTLAINHFRDFYTVPHLSISILVDLYKRDVSEIIGFFSESSRRNSCTCYMRGWRERNVFLNRSYKEQTK